MMQASFDHNLRRKRLSDDPEVMMYQEGTPGWLRRWKSSPEARVHAALGFNQKWALSSRFRTPYPGYKCLSRVSQADLRRNLPMFLYHVA
jgi:hypothetical protein